MKQPDNFQSGRIIALRELNFSIRKISEMTNIPKSTVAAFLQRYVERGGIERKSGSGRPSLVIPSEIELIKKIHAENPKFSAPKVNVIFQEKTKKKISDDTMRNMLHNAGLHAYSPIKKPLLSKKNKDARFEICTRWSYHPTKYWQQVIFSDECKFNLYNSDGCNHVWREPKKGLDPKYVETTVKFGSGNVMVWGCFSYSGVGKLVFIDETMDRILYTSILADNLSSSAEMMGLDNYVFQHDNDPKHSSKHVKNFLRNNKIEVLEWPSQSPDLNPIEHVWAYMKGKLKGKSYKRKEDLKEDLMAIWNDLSREFLASCINSMPKRIRSVILAKGGSTLY